VRVSKSKLESSYAIALARHLAAHPAPGAQNQPTHLASLDRFAEYLPGKSDFDFLPAERARSAFEDEQEIIRTGRPLIGKVERTPHLDGRVTWCLTTKMPWRDQEGQLIGTFGISRDITAIKNAEEESDKLNRQLMLASHQAGMAEVATGVLHNVGNVLNSINVSASIVGARLRQSRVNNITRTLALLREHRQDLASFLANDPKGKALPGYLETLADHLAAEQAEMLSEMAHLEKNVEHVKEIVAMQQSYAKRCGVVETVQAADLIEDAIRLNLGAFERHRIAIVRQFEPVPPFRVDKHRVLQILVNLMRNAKYAIDELNPAEKRLTLAIASAAPDRLRISVSDNGIGIAPENLRRIFGHGFTTKPDGHGFGLHSGALAAKEMGGQLTAQSDGPGCGATFCLELPLTQARPEPQRHQNGNRINHHAVGF